MKTMFMTVIAILGLAAVASARDTETFTLRQGQQKTVARGEVKVKFVSVTEDSRCPADAKCVWAGNAKVQVKVMIRRGAEKTMVMNTGMGPKGDQNDGWAVYLTSLTPERQSSRAMSQRNYTATFSIVRLQR